MNVTVPFSFGVLPVQHAGDAVADEEVRRRTRKVLVPLSLVAGAVCGWALIATLTAVVARPLTIETGLAGASVAHGEFN
jgi:hypothetical protein